MFESNAQPVRTVAQTVTPVTVEKVSLAPAAPNRNETALAAAAATQEPGVAGAVKAAVTPPPAKAEEKPVETEVAPKFAALAKKEKAIFEKDKALKAREAALAEKEGKLKVITDRKAEYLKNPGAVLEDAGITLEQLVQHLANGTVPQKSVIEALTEEVQGLKSATAAEKEAAAKANKDAEEAELVAQEAQAKLDIKELVEKGGEKFELTAAKGEEGQALIWEALRLSYTQHKKEISYEEAATIVENYLTAEAEKLLGTKKLGARFQPGKRKPISPTLTNAASATPPAPPGPKVARSDAERLQAAMAKLKAIREAK
jgi:hypothetical protein